MWTLDRMPGSHINCRKPQTVRCLKWALQNGEIRTVRQVTDKDAVETKTHCCSGWTTGSPLDQLQSMLTWRWRNSFPEVLSEFTDFTHDKDYNDNLTFYLVLALAVVSFLFIVSIIAILSVKCYRWRRERMFYKSGANLPVISVLSTCFTQT